MEHVHIRKRKCRGGGSAQCTASYCAEFGYTKEKGKYSTSNSKSSLGEIELKGEASLFVGLGVYKCIGFAKAVKGSAVKISILDGNVRAGLKGEISAEVHPFETEEADVYKLHLGTCVELDASVLHA